MADSVLLTDNSPSPDETPLTDRSTVLARTLCAIADNGYFIPIGILASQGPTDPIALAVVENLESLGLPKTGVSGLKILRDLATRGMIADMDIPPELFASFDLSDLIQVRRTGTEESVAQDMAAAAFAELVLEHDFYDGKIVQSKILEIDAGRNTADA